MSDFDSSLYLIKYGILQCFQLIHISIIWRENHLAIGRQTRHHVRFFKNSWIVSGGTESSSM